MSPLQGRLDRLEQSVLPALCGWLRHRGRDVVTAEFSVRPMEYAASKILWQWQRPVWSSLRPMNADETILVCLGEPFRALGERQWNRLGFQVRHLRRLPPLALWFICCGCIRKGIGDRTKWPCTVTAGGGSTLRETARAKPRIVRRSAARTHSPGRGHPQASLAQQ